MWSRALDSSSVLLSHPIASLSSPLTIILISTLTQTLKHPYLYIYIYTYEGDEFVMTAEENEEMLHTLFDTLKGKSGKGKYVYVYVYVYVHVYVYSSGVLLPFSILSLA